MTRRDLLRASCAVAFASRARAADQFESVRSMILDAHDSTDAPSIAVGVAVNGKVVWQEAFGWADRERRTIATEDTLYALSSLSKPLTATALMVFARAGKIDLDRPMNDYLGDAKILGRGGDAAKATVRLVANHSSGLPVHYDIFYADEPYRPPTMDETILRYGFLARPPGEEYEYSNLGYGMLGYALSRIAGEPYKDVMRRVVFAKLGMRRTWLDIAPGLEISTAMLYGSDGLPLPRYTTDTEAAAGIYSSVRDMLRFAMFHLKTRLSDQETILSDSDIDEMQKPTAVVNKDSGYGIGWGVVDMPAGYRMVLHNGSAAGVSTAIRLVPSEKIAIVVLCNSKTELPNTIASEIMRILRHGKPVPATTVAEPPRTRGTLEALFGTWQGRIHTYKGDLPFSLRFLESGDVHAQISTQLKTLLNSVSWQDAKLKGQMLGDVGTEDASRRPYTIALNLKHRGAILNGTAAALSTSRPRTGSELAYWTELVKQ